MGNFFYISRKHLGLEKIKVEYDDGFHLEVFLEPEAIGRVKAGGGHDVSSL